MPLSQLSLPPLPIGGKQVCGEFLPLALVSNIFSFIFFNFFHWFPPALISNCHHWSHHPSSNSNKENPTIKVQWTMTVAHLMGSPVIWICHQFEIAAAQVSTSFNGKPSFSIQVSNHIDFIWSLGLARWMFWSFFSPGPKLQCKTSDTTIVTIIQHLDDLDFFFHHHSILFSPLLWLLFL